MKPKKSLKKRMRREQDDNDQESERSQRRGEGHTSDTPDTSSSQQTRSSGIRQDLTIPRNLALAVRTLSSHMLPRWKAELWTSQTNRLNPTQGRPPVSKVKRVGTKPPNRISATRRQPTCCQIPLRPDLAQIKQLIKQDVTWREGRPMRPSTSRPMTPQSTPGPSSSATVPYGMPARPSDINNISESVAQSVRCLQLCSSSSDSSPSSTDTLPYRRTTPSFRMRRYRNQLEWYRTLRSEIKLKQHKKMLQQLYQENSKSARGAVPSEAAQADGPSGSQKRRPVDMNVTFKTAKRKRSPRSEQALTDMSCALHKMTRRSWRRQLDSSSSDSISPPPSLHTSVTSDSSQPAAVPHAAPEPSGPSQCVEIDLFLTCSPAKTTPHKVSQGQREGQNPGISSTIKAASTKVSAAGTDVVVCSPSTEITPCREHLVGTLSEKESQGFDVTNSVKASRTVVKATRKDTGSSVKMTKGLCNERVSQTPATSGSVTKASGNTEVKSSSTKAKINTNSNSQDLKLKATPGAKPKTPKTKERPLPDTPRPKRAKVPASFCKVLLGPGRQSSVSACESQFTSSSSSTSLQHTETQRKTVKKNDRSSSSCIHKKPSTSGADSVKNNKCKKPSTTFSTVDSKNFVKKSKSLHETVIEGQDSQAGNVKKGPHVEQAQLTSNAGKTQESDRSYTSSPSGLRSTSEHKKEPWSKKKYLLKKAAMDTSVTVTMVKIPDTVSGLGSAGDAAVSLTQIRPCSVTSPLTLSNSTTSLHDPVLNQQSTNLLTLCETTTPTINQEPTTPLILSKNTTAALRDSTNASPASKISQGSTNSLTLDESTTTVHAPLVYQQPTHLLTLSERASLAPASIVNQSSPNPVSLSEGTVPAPFSIFSLGPITPGQSWAPRPEYRFLRQTAKPKSKTCGAKRRKASCFLKPDPPGPKSRISHKIITGISAASTTTTTTTSINTSTSTTTTNNTSSNTSTTTSSSIAEARRGPVETQYSQPSAEASVTLLGAPSKDAPQGCPTCHDYAAPSGSTPMGTDTSQDSAAQGASDDHGPPLEDLPSQSSNERKRDVEDSAANVPRAFLLHHQSGRRRSDPGGQAHLSTSHVPMLASERRRVITDLVRAVTSMLGIEIRPAASTALAAGPPHQQPVLVHPHNIHAIQNQPPQMYYHIQAPPLPMHNSRHGAGPPSSRAEQTSVLTPLHTVVSQTAPAHSSEMADGRDHASD